jgi:hypothetical protein
MHDRLPEEGGVLRYVCGNPIPELLADAELSNDRLIALGIVSFEVVE